MTSTARGARKPPAKSVSAHNAAMSHLATEAQRTERSARSHRFPGRPRDTLGLRHVVPPYAGPKRFPLVRPGLAVEAALTVFEVERDERRHQPYGCFKVSLRGVYLGTALSFPDFDTCEHFLNRTQTRLRADLSPEASRDLDLLNA